MGLQCKEVGKLKGMMKKLQNKLDKQKSYEKHKNDQKVKK